MARILYDSRDNPANALKGWYASVLYHPSFTALGSQRNWAQLQIDIRKYLKLRKDGRNVLAFWQFDWLSVGGKAPYLLLPSTGWDDQFNTGRGYIQGRYRGTDMTYLEVEDRFAISRDGLFGGVVFANVESFKRNLATSFNEDIPGWGMVSGSAQQTLQYEYLRRLWVWVTGLAGDRRQCRGSVLIFPRISAAPARFARS